MPCLSDEEDQIAPSPPCFTTPTKAICNEGARHADPDAAEPKAFSDPDVEKQFDELAGKKLEYCHPYLQYREVMQWKTGPDPLLEPC
jgi:hypothetical protein